MDGSGSHRIDRAAGCKDCRHFFVTYDPRFPYGCRSMGFKSFRYPCFEVQEASGDSCQAREIRNAPGAE
jgi:hypothetical protein